MSFFCLNIMQFIKNVDNISTSTYNFLRKVDMPMVAASRKRIERQTSLLHLLQSSGSIPIDQLARQMEVSSSTLRRELRDLTNESLVTVTIGKVSLATP